jgi:hypothetical protein
VDCSFESKNDKSPFKRIVTSGFAALVSILVLMAGQCPGGGGGDEGGSVTVETTSDGVA